MKKLILMLLATTSIHANPPKISVATKATGTVMAALVVLVGYYAVWCAAREA